MFEIEADQVFSGMVKSVVILVNEVLKVEEVVRVLVKFVENAS